MTPPKRGKPGYFDRADRQAARDRQRGNERAETDRYHRPERGVSVPDRRRPGRKRDYRG